MEDHGQKQQKSNAQLHDEALRYSEKMQIRMTSW